MQVTPYAVDSLGDPGSSKLARGQALPKAPRLLKGYVVKRNTYAPTWLKFGSIHIYDSLFSLKCNWVRCTCLKQVTSSSPLARFWTIRYHSCDGLNSFISRCKLLYFVCFMTPAGLEVSFQLYEGYALNSKPCVAVKIAYKQRRYH